MSKNFKLKLPTIDLYGKIYKLGLGGLHSKDTGQQSIYKSSKEMMLLDADVTSYYPISLINFDNCPEHLDIKIFKKVLSNMFTQRNDAKKKKKELFFNCLQYGLKIGLNTIYGLFAFAYFFLFDLKCTYKTTINNQLFLLRLIEDLNLEGIEVISANTDGILMYFDKNRYEEVLDICKKWEEEFNFNLEYTSISLYVRKDVNNYIAVKDNGEVKVKGIFTPSGAEVYPYYKFDAELADNGYYRFFNSLLTGFSIPPVVSIALLKYYIDGINIEETIENHRDIYDFCMTQKIGKQFTNYLEYVKRNITYRRPNKKKKILIKEREVLEPVYEYYVEEKKLKTGEIKSTVKRKKISGKKIIPAEYGWEEIPGEEYVHPKIIDEKISEEILQKSVRFYITNPTVDEEGNLWGYSLKKEKMLDDGKPSRTEYCAKQFVKLFMNYFEAEDFEDYDINYDYYVSLARKIIIKIEKCNFGGIVIETNLID